MAVLTVDADGIVREPTCCETAQVRAVLVTPGFPTSLDDHHKPFLADHARALAEAGAEVTVVCPAHPDAPRRHEMGGVEVCRVRFAPARVEARVALGESYRVFSGLSALWVIPMIARLTLTAVRQARRRPSAAASDSARRVSPTHSGPVIHGHWWFPCGLVAVAAAMAAGRHVASVVQVHGSDAAVTTNAVHRWLARRVLRRSGAVVTVSEDLRDWAASLVPHRGGLHPPPSAEPEGRRPGPLLRIVSMPVGADRLGSPTPTPPDGPVVAVGRLMAEKGFDVLIEAVALMPTAERPEVVIVGDGPDRTLLEALALRRSVTVQFVGAVAPSEVGQWYQRARLVCVPSRREGFGMVVAEALAAGRTVVATRVGAAPQFITDGTNGYLVRPDDARALAEALATALHSNDAVTFAARTDVLAPFGPQAHAAALLDLYAELSAK
ncbi:glycosyltransferase [Candidatus Poriferisodalis sp.]|uniref:glycosyltransferase n=1 Tax=Candidatus Poriferisodalis sp. TaxID=3101277 RepID=UPI003B5A021A